MNRSMLLVVCGLTLLMTMGISTLLPLLPFLASHFGTSPDDSWKIIVAMALPGLICIPFVGVWADRHGRKQVLVPSLILFAAGGFCCMFAQSFTQLLVFRVIQGMGSAPMGLLYSTIIADTWQDEQRVKAMSHCSVCLGLGTAAGPVIGGALAVLDWRLPFALPLLALPLAALALRLPLARPENSGSFRAYMQSAISCARQRQTLALLGLTLLTFIMLSGPIITCFPLLADKLFNASPLESGLIISASSLATGLTAWLLPRLSRRFSTRPLLLTSCALYAVALWGIALTTNLWWLAAPIIIYGFAQGLNIPMVSTLLTGQAPDGQRAALMAANAILLRLGQNAGPAVFGLLAGNIGPDKAIAAGTILVLGMAALVLTTPLPELQQQ